MITLGQDTNAYYRFHSKIYDLTRWTFLFGRKAMVHEIVRRQPQRVLEVGCGTGRNLIDLKRMAPQVTCVGIDASAEMLNIARSKVARSGLTHSHQAHPHQAHSYKETTGITFLEGRYPSKDIDEALAELGDADVILFSYALSMFNPGYDECLKAAYQRLAPGGVVCIVDFHFSPFAWFRRWMAMNHVRMDAHLKDALMDLGELSLYREQSGLFGLWRYSQMISQPRTP